MNLRWKSRGPGLIGGKPKPAESGYPHNNNAMAQEWDYGGYKMNPSKNRAAHLSILPVLPQVPEHLQAPGVGWKQSPALIYTCFCCLCWGHTFLIYGTANGEARLWVMQGSRMARAAVVPKRSRSSSEPGNKRPEYKTPRSAPAEGAGGNAAPSAPQLNFLGSIAGSILMTPYGNKGRQMLRCREGCVRVHKRSQIFHTC